MNRQNEVTLTLRVSNDTEKRKAVRKVSDKMICISAYLNTGKNQNGDYNPILDFDINVFTKNAKTPTKFVDTSQINPGDYITVKGSLGSTGVVVKGSKYTNMVIFAAEVVVENTKDEETVNIWNNE